MKFLQLKYCLFAILCLAFLGGCSSDQDNTEDQEMVSEDNGGDNPDPIEDGNNNDNPDNGGEDVTASLLERYVFDENIVIEHSYNTGGCESPPCDTDEDSLVDIFVNTMPNAAYFSLSEDTSELLLECQLDKGRRAEFKQISKGPLSAFAKLEFQGVYYDIPANGVTIAQVHNRGGTSNKPFFRLVLHEDGLETVIRKDPEVSSSNTTFQKETFSFIDGANYDQSSLTIAIEKSDGFVHISVDQNGVLILNESYQPENTTEWVNNNGIANGFYLKAGLYNDDGPHTKNLVVGYATVVFESNDQK